MNLGNLIEKEIWYLILCSAISWSGFCHGSRVHFVAIKIVFNDVMTVWIKKQLPYEEFKSEKILIDSEEQNRFQMYLNGILQRDAHGVTDVFSAVQNQH